MRSPRLPHALRDERGLTLIELMMAMTIGLIVAFATLTVFEGFDRGIASTGRTTDAEDNGRRDVANMVRILRDAGAPSPVTGSTPTTVTRASGTDIVFLSTSWPNESASGVTSGNHIERLCLDESTDRIWFEGLRAGTAGPSDPGAACPSGAAGWERSVISTNVANTAALPVFRLGAATPVRTVGIQLRTDTGTNVHSRSLSLSSGSALRGALAPQVSEDDVDVDCNHDGSGKALLSLGASTPNLKLEAAGAVALGPGKVLFDIAAGASANVTLTVTNALGLQTLLFKEVSCP